MSGFLIASAGFNALDEWWLLPEDNLADCTLCGAIIDVHERRAYQHRSGQVACSRCIDTHDLRPRASRRYLRSTGQPTHRRHGDPEAERQAIRAALAAHDSLTLDNLAVLLDLDRAVVSGHISALHQRREIERDGDGWRLRR